MKRVTILGSTGSIGTQALDIIRANPDKFEVVGLTCGQNADLFVSQIAEFKPAIVASGDQSSALTIENKIKERGIEYDGEILYGEDGISEVASFDSDIVLNSLMGMRGLIPTIKAIESGHDIALANKETLVAGGNIVMKLAREKGIKLLPVDSEHSAIFQCLEGNRDKEIKRILLTASGGPFRGWSVDKLCSVTPEMALKHPNWSMGKKITIDSATMMNKGLEIIEAMHLFDVPTSKIKVLIHPQSIVHSGVEFVDTAVLAQLGTPDMKVPISVALNYPDRLDLESSGSEELDFFGKASELTFEEPDLNTFKCLDLAIKAANLGGVMPAIMNGANEILVDAFLNGDIRFTDIAEIIEETMDNYKGGGIDSNDKEPTLEDILSADNYSRTHAKELIEDYKRSRKPKEGFEN